MKRIIALIMIVTLICGLTACGEKEEASSSGSTAAASNDDFYHGYVSSQDSVIHKTSYGTYVHYVNLAYTDSAFEIESNWDKLIWTIYDGISYKGLPYRTAQDGNDFYGWHNADYSALYHYTALDESTAKAEVWIDSEQLKNSCLAHDNSRGYIHTLSNFLADGDSIYAGVRFDPDYMINQPAFNGRLVRFSESGDAIEFVGDESVRASEFVVKDGWIYYADNGYVTDGSSIDYDDGKTGLYKIRTDGSEKTLLLSGSGSGEGYTRLGNVGDLALFGEYLYFLDLSDGTGSYPARIKTDGTGYERLSDTSAYVYTLDTEKPDLYYETGEFGYETSEKKSVKMLSLDTKEEKTLYETERPFQTMTFCDGKLYYWNWVLNDILCYRTDPATGKTSQLVTRTEGEKHWEKDSDGKNKLVDESKTIVAWYDE